MSDGINLGIAHTSNQREHISKTLKLHGDSKNGLATILSTGTHINAFFREEKTPSYNPDLKQILPKIKVKGVESHKYPIEQAMKSVKQEIVLCPYDKLPFKDNSFDFIIAFASIYMLNFKGVLNSLREVQRVGKGKSYVTLGAYRTKEEKELFLEWTLLGTTVLHEDEWLEVFKETGYTGDYFFSSAKSLHLVRG